MDEFSTIYVFTEKNHLVWSGTGEIAFGLLVFVFSLFWLAYSFLLLASRKDKKRISHIILSMVLLYGGNGWVRQGFETVQYYRDEYSRFQEIYTSQKYRIAEGPVHVIKVKALGKQDIVQIGNVDFEVSCYGTLQFTYSKALYCNGVLAEGVYARIYYQPVTGDSLPIQYPEILRVDVRK
jgi:hypothetical protein